MGKNICQENGFFFSNEYYFNTEIHQENPLLAKQLEYQNDEKKKNTGDRKRKYIKIKQAKENEKKNIKKTRREKRLNQRREREQKQMEKSKKKRKRPNQLQIEKENRKKKRFKNLIRRKRTNMQNEYDKPLKPGYRLVPGAN